MSQDENLKEKILKC